MNKIESYLLHVDKKQKWMIYITFFILIGFVISGIATPMIDEQESLETSLAAVESNIAKDSINTIKKEISLRKKELMQVNEEIENQKEKITVLMSNLYKIQYAFFNEKELANALDEILKKSVNNNLQIDFIKNIEVTKNSMTNILKHKKSMEISGSGGYKEIVGFVNHIENLNVLLKFTKIKIESSTNGVKFNILLDIYGIGL